MKILKKVLAALLISAFCISTFPLNVFAETSNPYVVPADLSAEGYKLFKENDKIALLYNADSSGENKRQYGNIILVDKSNNNYIWRSGLSEAQLNSDDIAVEDTKNFLSSVISADVIMEGSVIQLCSNGSKVNYFVVKESGDKLIYTVNFLERITSVLVGAKDYSYDITITLELSLEDDHLVADLLLNGSLDESGSTKGQSKLSNISIMPGFGAAGQQEKGYIVIPDGSGATIDFNTYFNSNMKKENIEYSASVYGDDMIFQDSTRGAIIQNPVIPVMGFSKENAGLMISVDNAASLGVATAMISGVNCRYNYAYIACELRKYENLKGGAYNTTSSDFQFNQGKIEAKKFTINYYPLKAGENQYSDMANRYKEEIVKKYNLTNKKSSGVPIVVEAIGGIKEIKHFLGIPYTGLKKLTTYDQAQKIIDSLKEIGFTDINFRYKGWQKGGMDDVVPNKMSADFRLGGKGGLKDLINDSNKDENVNLFLDVDFARYYKDSTSVLKLVVAAKDLNYQPVYCSEYRRSNRYLRDDKKFNLIHPEKILGIANSFLNDAKKYNIENLSVAYFGQYIHSAFNQDNTSDKSHSEIYIDEVVKNIDQNISNKIMIEYGNLYVAKYADVITNLPTYSSHLDIQSREIPFVQMVYSGLFDIAGVPINLESERNEMILKAAESAMPVNFSLFSAESNSTKGSKYNEYYACNVEDNIPLIKEVYERLKPVYDAVGNSAMQSHTFVNENVGKTVFTNGAVVYVNYGEQDVNVENITVKANDFVVVGGGN